MIGQSTIRHRDRVQPRTRRATSPVRDPLACAPASNLGAAKLNRDRCPRTPTAPRQLETPFAPRPIPSLSPQTSLPFELQCLRVQAWRCPPASALRLCASSHSDSDATGGPHRLSLARPGLPALRHAAVTRASGATARVT
eukprot:977459-Rhodomonas_salina.1